jgi:TRAP-type C4-dicarboxylate transport system substrate-binding protein
MLLQKKEALFGKYWEKKLRKQGLKGGNFYDNMYKQGLNS